VLCTLIENLVGAEHLILCRDY